ncbi:MAG: PhnD/SsuA/transferrin family substrate-binding protein [Candidatus Omnitrophica bacterium]|nr:PhnD/SsuA/transferrin family substrate-binding protein [Candidatus Omnitrophota bacterium]
MMGHRIVKLLAVVLVCFYLDAAAYAASVYKVAVLANKGKEECAALWQPTINELNAKNLLGLRFELVPMTFKEMLVEIEAPKSDFLILNPNYYVQIELAQSGQAIATLVNKRLDKALTVFGGVIFTRKGRGMRTFADLKGRTLAIPDEESFGGYLSEAQTLKEQGISVKNHFRKVVALYNQDEVVLRVMDGTYDVGFVRTDTLETLASKGLVNLSRVSVIKLPTLTVALDFPFLVSTALYPEWPFVKLNSVSREAAEEVSRILLSIKPESDAAKAGKYFGWTTPLNYRPVHECLRSLRVGGYKDFDRSSFLLLWEDYAYYFLGGAGLFVLLCSGLIVNLALGRRVRKNEELLRTVTDFTYDWEYWISKNGEFKWMSPSCEKFTGHKPADFKQDAQLIFAVIHPDDRDAVRRHMSATHQSEGKCESEFRIIDSAGNVRWMQHVCSPVFGRKGEFIGRRACNRDITELRQAKEVAESASKVKSDFMANMSHEIRTPMNAVLGFSQLMKRTDMSDKQKYYVTAILSSGQLLLSIINDILDISKITSGHMALEKIPFDLRETLTEAMRVVEPQVQSPRAHMTAHIDPVITGRYEGDPVRLRQVLINLLGNAAKFTASGEIVLTVRRQSVRGGQEHFLFSVKDTGIGISDKKLKSIFDPFMQADTSTTREFGGTGLGLSISKFVVEHMGGKLEVRSKIGEGSEFYFSISLPRLFLSGEIVPDKPAVEVSASTIGARLLIAEDNPANQALMKEFVAMLDCTADYASNGQEAVDLLRQGCGKYDVCLMDIQMPVMGGIEALNIIRTSISRDFPVIALTAAAMSGEKERLMELGMTDYLSKPVMFEDLKAKVLQYRKKK